MRLYTRESVFVTGLYLALQYEARLCQLRGQLYELEVPKPLNPKLDQLWPKIAKYVDSSHWAHGRSTYWGSWPAANRAAESGEVAFCEKTQGPVRKD